RLRSVRAPLAVLAHRLGDPRRQRPAHLLELRASGHLLGVDRGLDAVEQALEPADQLGLRDPELRIRRGRLAERLDQPVELLAELRREALLELADGGAEDPGEAAAP